jgi:two-component system, OmpR family, phosphate regulon sensor histidine kinase PhoR
LVNEASTGALRLLLLQRVPVVHGQLELEAARGRALVEESREMVMVLDDDDRVVAASKRARESLEGLAEGEPVPAGILHGERGHTALVIPYEVNGTREQLLYLSEPGDLVAYEELRAGFTAAVSHELRTPLARLLSLLETALLPGEDAPALVEQARAEVEHIRELIDDVLFLSELETGRAVVSLSSTRVLPVLDEVGAELAESAERAAVTLEIRGDPSVELALRPRMLRMVARNLGENAIRYSGPGATCTLAVAREDGRIVLSASDNGIGVPAWDLPRLFERFYRADRARASRGTGLGLAIVKHVVTSAGGAVEARGDSGQGLEIRCTFPGDSPAAPFTRE